MTFEILEFTVSKFLVPTLINGDYSSLIPEECEKFDSFVESLPLGHFVQVDDSENYLTCEILNQVSETVTIELHVPTFEYKKWERATRLSPSENFYVN